MEEKDASQPNFDESVGLATFSTSSSSVKSNIRFFERMWEEETLLEMERKIRREAELLQDILAHDLRNFNQIILSNADVMLQEGNKLSLEQRKTMLTEIVTAVERSAKLMDRAKRLGRIINEESKLRPINLVESLERAV